MQGFIIAGGKSNRMGRPKAELMLDGASFIDRAALALSAIAGEGIHVAGGASGGSRGLSVLADLDLTENGERPAGAIVGLYTALSQARSDWIAVLACDLPFVSGAFLEKLAACDKAGFDAVVPVQSDGIPQPLCALYRREACLPVALELAMGSDRSLQSMLKQIITRFVGYDEFSGLAGAEYFFLNVNSPDDYLVAKGLIEK